MIQRIDNVGVAVSDLERSVAFYEALGFSVESRDETPAATLAAGEARMWVFQTTAAERDAGRRPELVGNRPGLDHLSFWSATSTLLRSRLVAPACSSSRSRPTRSGATGRRACSIPTATGSSCSATAAVEAPVPLESRSDRCSLD